jgi:hypothetical protein
MRFRVPLSFVLPPVGLLVAILLLAAAGPWAGAQTPAQVQHVQDPRNYNATRTGEVVDLGPLWLFQEGDNPAFAATDFDDSQWPTVTTRKGFASQGYPNVNQFWYRVHLRVRPDSGPLVLGITTFYGSYEIFVNGVRIGGEGKMSGGGDIRGGRLILFGIPKEAVRSGQLVVALHGAVGAFAYASESFYEGVTATSGRIMIGGPVALAPLTFESYMRAVLVYWIFLGLVSFVVFIVLALYRALPDQKEYLTIALCGGFQLLAVCSHPPHRPPAPDWLRAGAWHWDLRRRRLPGPAVRGGAASGGNTAGPLDSSAAGRADSRRAADRAAICRRRLALYTPGPGVSGPDRPLYRGADLSLSRDAPRQPRRPGALRLPDRLVCH